MGQLKPMGRYPVVFLTSILLIVIFIPRPVQGLCIGPEACGVIVGTWLSMLTVSICLVLFAFAIWPKTRPWLGVLAVLPGFMAILTGYLMVFRVARFDLIGVPLIHAGLMIVMIRIGRSDSNKESKNEET
ncbi:MAG: hypothetical protein VYC60_00355 [Candidatus Thermoplasmatota archaeon]|nr:hypothetical protein [Candidatus Thermoplasmatota archaeon]